MFPIPKRSRRSRRYLFQLIVLTLGYFFSVSLLNIIVDPFEIFQWVDVPAFRSQRGLRLDRVRNAAVASTNSSRILLVGDSRVQAGLNDHSPELLKLGSCRNLAVPGCSAYEAFRMVELSQSATRPKRVIWGMDPEALSVFSSEAVFEESKLSMLNVDLDRWAYFQFFLTSPKSIVSSSHVIWRSIHAVLPTKPKAGAISGETSRPPHAPRMATVAEVNDKILGAMRSRVTLEEVLTVREPDLDLLAQRLEQWQSHGTHIVLMFPPMHAVVHAAVFRNPVFREQSESQARWLMQCVDGINAKHPERPAIEVWDFRGFSERHCEWRPDGTAGFPTRWFSDPLHMDRSLGEFVLRRLLSSPDADESFGVRLSSDNIEAHLADLRRQLADYEQRCTEQIAVLEQVENRAPPEWRQSSAFARTRNLADRTRIERLR